MKISKSFILSSLLLSCFPNSYKQMSEWESFLGKGLKKSNEEFSRFLFLDDRNALLIGTNYTDEILLQKKFDQQNAVVYRSGDSAKSWSEIVVGNGRLRDLIYVDNVIFTLSNQMKDDNEEISTIYFSRDKGLSWDFLTSFPFMVRDLVFVDSLNGLIVCKDIASDKSWTILQTNNGGRSWSKILEDDEIKSIVGFRKSVYYLTTLDNGSEAIVEFDIPFNLKRTLNLPLGYEYRIANNDDAGKLWLSRINKKTKMISIVSMNERGDLSGIEVQSAKGYFPVFMNVKGERFSIIAGKTGGGSVDYKFFQTINGGQDWISEVPPIVLTPY